MPEPGEVIYWTPDGDEAPKKARAFCRSRGLGREHVRIVKREVPHMGRMVVVEVAKRCRLKIGS